MTRSLALCYGTRPQIIKASVLAQQLRSRWALSTIDTGQHYDYELNGLLYEQLGVAKADHCLDVASCGPTEQVGKIVIRAGAVLERVAPAAVVVIGDTNSTLGCAIAAAKLGQPVIHVEAGLRATERNLPEELNRQIVDRLSAVLCTPSQISANRLQAEAVRGTVVVTGDIARDVLLKNLSRAPATWAAGLPAAARGLPFAFATFHRASLTADPSRLSSVLSALGTIGLPVIFAVHPRTRAALGGEGWFDQLPPTVHPRPPLGYLDTIACVRDARIVVTDSGGVQREAYWLGTPCLTVRDETEWTELVHAGANRLVPPDDAAAVLSRRAADALAAPRDWNRDAIGSGDAALRIADAIHRFDSMSE